MSIVCRDVTGSFIYRIRLLIQRNHQRKTTPPQTWDISHHRTGLPVAENAGQVWTDFMERYEALTSVLCSAAKSGCTTEYEKEYARLRGWFVAHYKQVAPRLRQQWNESAFEESLSHGQGPKNIRSSRRSDPFEALFLPLTLEAVLRQDTGDLIPRIMQISETIYHS